MGSPGEVRCYKAEPIYAGEAVPDLDIRSNGESAPIFLGGAQGGNFEEWQVKARAFYAREADNIMRALLATLPGGTVDALLVALLEHKRSMFRVLHDAPSTALERRVEQLELAERRRGGTGGV